MRTKKRPVFTNCKIFLLALTDITDSIIIIYITDGIQKESNDLKKCLTNVGICNIIIELIVETIIYGGIAQLARAFGSYPECRRFESHYRYQYGPVVKRLRHRPFTAVTRVRFPSGSPKRKS